LWIVVAAAAALLQGHLANSGACNLQQPSRRLSNAGSCSFAKQQQSFSGNMLQVRMVCLGQIGELATTTPAREADQAMS
jgi:hypothetical protein